MVWALNNQTACVAEVLPALRATAERIEREPATTARFLRESWVRRVLW
ncbi:hypothetical protein ACWDSL_27320 [Streptomyces sp. NPDC000941]